MSRVTVAIFRDVAMQLAVMWQQYVQPTPFEGTFRIGNVLVELRVSECKQVTQ